MNNTRVALTIDIHPKDDPKSIAACNEFLLHRGIPGTFLISTIILDNPSVHGVLRELSSAGHELGTHSHTHSFDEILALQNGDKQKLAFLRDSTSRFEDFFGHKPLSFRSPVWCGLGKASLDELADLGYKVDSSSTPQRLGVLGSFPLENPWLAVSRKPYFIAPDLLEVPSSSFLVPLASPTFATFRRTLSLAFLKLFLLESDLCSDRNIVFTFDTQDFDKHRPHPPVGYRWRQLFPKKVGGFEFRWWLRNYDPATIYELTCAVTDVVLKCKCMTLSSIRDEIIGPVTIQKSAFNTELVQ